MLPKEHQCLLIQQWLQTSDKFWKKCSGNELTGTEMQLCVKAHLH